MEVKAKGEPKKVEDEAPIGWKGLFNTHLFTSLFSEMIKSFDLRSNHCQMIKSNDFISNILHRIQLKIFISKILTHAMFV